MAEKTKLLVRIANTDLDGKKQVLFALQKIKGVSTAFANAICAVAQVDREAILGDLPQDKITKLNDTVKNPQLPAWLLNHRKDIETGTDMHLISADLSYKVENDVRRMSNTKSYVGLRHVWHLPVRGQRNKANHRPTKQKNSKAAKRGKKVN